ncbi:MAG: RNA polymerase sporulation sigma factor SigK [Clostridia bacterium]|nr:RNA polymerase sporulation sigma factor SigK [Clostridia bacterium]
MVLESFAYFLSRICLFSNYVNTAQGFPKPLSIEEEQAEFEKMKRGDKKAREKLITHNLRLVAHIVKKYTYSLEADDLLSVGTIGLIKAIDSFDYTKKVQLSTYAARCINNEILMLIRANKKHKNVISINSLTCNGDDDKDLELKDVLAADDEEVFVQVESNIMMQKIKKIIAEKLNEREQTVVKLRYGIDCQRALTQKEVSQVLGISRSYISRIENKTLKIIKDEFDKAETKEKKLKNF